MNKKKAIITLVAITSIIKVDPSPVRVKLISGGLSIIFQLGRLSVVVRHFNVCSMTKVLIIYAEVEGNSTSASRVESNISWIIQSQWRYICRQICGIGGVLQ